MSNLLQFVGGQRRIKQIVGSSSGHGFLFNDCGLNTTPFNAPSPAGQLQTVLSIAGAGALKAVALKSAIAPATSFRLRITLDGLVVIDRTVGLSGEGGYVGLGFPSVRWSDPQVRYEISGIAPDRAPFASSCLVEVSVNAVNVNGGGGLALLAWEVYE